MKEIKKLIQHLFLAIDRLNKRMSENNLIVFDRKVIFLIFFSIIAFFVLTFFKINYSSISYWDTAVPEKGDEKLNTPLFGSPKGMRSDEWHVITPFMLSQSEQDPSFPISNESIGAEKSPLLMSLPVSHFSTVFRPQNWGFFFLDLERAYAFYWNFKIIGLVMSVFFLLLLLTKNNFWISLFGSLWLFFSSYIQWWFSTPAMLPEMITSFCFVFIGLAYLLSSKNSKSIFVGSLLMLIFGINFVLFFYPPFQLTLVYLFAFLFIGYFWKNFDRSVFNQFRNVRLLSFLLFVGLSSLTLFLFYQEAKETISVMMQTVYPGKRILTGGEVDVPRIFSGYFDSFWNDRRFPKKMGFEGNFVLFFPLVFLLLIVKIIKNRKTVREDLDKYFLGLYIVFLLAWILVGFPDSFAKFSLFDMIHPLRTFLGLGIASILLTTMFLSETNDNNSTIVTRKNLLYFSLFFILIILLGRYYLDDSINLLYIGCFSIAISFLAVMLLLRRWVLFFIPLLILITLPNFPVNPMTYGLGPIQKKELVVFIKEKGLNKMYGKWLIFGNYFVANLIKTTGVSVINGVNFLPEDEKTRILDPENKNEDVYNRYANIEYTQSEEANPVFTLDYLDKYTVAINPCSQKIKEIGVKYIILPKSYKNTDCLLRITEKPLNKMHIYTYKD